MQKATKRAFLFLFCLFRFFGVALTDYFEEDYASSHGDIEGADGAGGGD